MKNNSILMVVMKMLRVWRWIFGLCLGFMLLAFSSLFVRTNFLLPIIAMLLVIHIGDITEPVDTSITGFVLGLFNQCCYLVLQTTQGSSISFSLITVVMVSLLVGCVYGVIGFIFGHLRKVHAEGEGILF